MARKGAHPDGSFGQRFSSKGAPVAFLTQFLRRCCSPAVYTSEEQIHSSPQSQGRMQLQAMVQGSALFSCELVREQQIELFSEFMFSSFSQVLT